MQFGKRKLYNDLNYLVMPGRFTSKVNIVETSSECEKSR